MPPERFDTESFPIDFRQLSYDVRLYKSEKLGFRASLPEEIMFNKVAAMITVTQTNK